MSDQPLPLHPNLARIAAAYDDICNRWVNGLVTTEQANIEIAALAARDDQGVVWRIDAKTGHWHYQTIDGRLVAGTPPMYGFATLTGHDVSSNPTRPNPANSVMFEHVQLPDAPGSLVGSTRRPATIIEQQPARRWPWIVTILALAGAVAALSGATWLNWF